MTSFLAGPLKKAIAKGFKGKLLKGTIRRFSYTIDGRGDRIPTGFTDYAFQGIRETYDAKYRAQALIPETDVKILVILGLAGTTPERTDKIFVNGAWHEIREVPDIDPAGASASLQCYQVPTATATLG